MPPSDPILVHGEPLSICWGCNAPWVASGYGQQTALIVPSLRDLLGCRMAVSSTFGHFGTPIVWNGITVYPPAFEAYSNDIHAANARQHGAHLLLTHQDVPWQEPDKLAQGGTRWAPWFPIDHTPLSHTIASRLHPEYCYQPLVLSHFGLHQAEAAGIDARLVCQGIDTALFRPGDRAAAREQLGWPQDAFLVGMVATNSGYPNRKAYAQQLRAFRAFAERHGDAVIYIHAYGDSKVSPNVTTRLGWHLGDELLDSGRVLWAHPYDLNQGYRPEDMVLRYQAFDVLLSVSMAEGCCLPLLEAQSCGVPVIGGDWSAMGENVYAGWKVDEWDSQVWYVDPLECEWRLPNETAIEVCLNEAYRQLQNADERAWLAEHGRAQMVAHHDQAHITETQWRPVLQEIAQRIEAEKVPWHVHRWQGVGLLDNQGRAITRCAVADCPTEAEVLADGSQQMLAANAPIVIGGIALDIQDDPAGGVARQIAGEVEKIYRLPDIELQPGDVVLDIGAHVGVVSCYLAKRFPQARIIAYEPHPANFERLVRNLDANGCHNVFCYPKAVTADGRDLTLRGDHATNTGGYSAWTPGPDAVTVESIEPWQLEGLEGQPLALLKLDCEGAEYEILHALGGNLRQVDHLIMEVHENTALRILGGPAADLIAYARQYVTDVRATVMPIPDAQQIEVHLHGAQINLAVADERQPDMPPFDPAILAAEQEYAAKMDALEAKAEASAARKIVGGKQDGR